MQRACIFAVQVRSTAKSPTGDLQAADPRDRDTAVPARRHHGGGPGEPRRTSPRSCATSGHPPPVVTTPAGTGNHSASEILATGDRQSGHDRIAPPREEESGGRGHLRVRADLHARRTGPVPDPGRQPHPPKALPFLSSGSKVPVKIGRTPTRWLSTGTPRRQRTRTRSNTRPLARVLDDTGKWTGVTPSSCSLPRRRPSR